MTDRAKPTRWYTDGADLIGRQNDAETDRFATASLPSWLAVEGYVAMRSKGAAHADIVSGAARIDRAIPSGGNGRTTEDAKWREAIAYAVAEEDTKAGFVGVARETKEAAIADGRTYAATLSKQDVRDAQARQSVMTWYAKLHGAKGPIRPAAPMAEAAD